MKLRTPGKFGHTFADSGNPDETAPYEPSHQDFHCLLTIVDYCFYYINFNMNQTRSLSEFT